MTPTFLPSEKMPQLLAMKYANRLKLLNTMGPDNLDFHLVFHQKTKLVNWIKSQCTQMPDGSDPSVFHEQLKKAKVDHEQGSDITYNISR